MGNNKKFLLFPIRRYRDVAAQKCFIAMLKRAELGRFTPNLTVYIARDTLYVRYPATGKHDGERDHAR